MATEQPSTALRTSSNGLWKGTVYDREYGSAAMVAEGAGCVNLEQACVMPLIRGITHIFQIINE